MSEVLPIQSLPSDEPIPNPHQNPNPNPSIPQCEALGRSWLFSLPHPRSPSPAEIDAWIESNLSSFPSDFSSLPRAQLHRWILSLNSNPNPNPNPSPSPNPSSSQAEHPYRFQRTDLWLPVYEWLESLDKDQLVSGKEITDWLAENTEFRDRVLSRHSKYHLMHYIQKLHLKVLKKRGKLPKTMLLSTARASVKSPNGGAAVRQNSFIRSVKNSCSGARMQEDYFLCKPSIDILNDKMFSCKKSEAALRYQAFTEPTDSHLLKAQECCQFTRVPVSAFA